MLKIDLSKTVVFSENLAHAHLNFPYFSSKSHKIPYFSSPHAEKGRISTHAAAGRDNTQFPAKFPPLSVQSPSRPRLRCEAGTVVRILRCQDRGLRSVTCRHAHTVCSVT